MNSDRPLWPRWARNLFLIQLMLNLVIWIAVFGFIFAGRVRQRVEVESLAREVAAQKDQFDRLRDEVAAAKAGVGTTTGAIGGFEMRLQTMDTWIQTTRGRLKESGFDTPNYSPYKE